MRHFRLNTPKRPAGFTLAELLICIAILGEIATFTIPKIITAQTNTRFNAIAKEDVAMVAAAYQYALYSGKVTTSTAAKDLSQYMNYIAVTTADIDDVYSLTTTGCTGLHTCIKLHNGSTLLLDNVGFGGNASTNAIMFQIDPDGQLDGGTTGAGKGVQFFM